jgi:hypothetical protein
MALTAVGRKKDTSSEPDPEFGPAMRALHPRWQRVAVALFATNGDRTAALRLCGYKADNGAALKAQASRLFADNRMRAAIRELAAAHIDIAEPEMLSATMSILRNVGEPGTTRLAAIRMIWDRANPVMTKHKIEIEHHVSNDERDMQHYRALKRIGAPQEAFISRFGPNGLARVEALILAEETKRREIEGPTIETEYEAVEAVNE